MDTAKLKKFAQYARRSLIDQVSNKLVLVLSEDSAARRESATAVKKLEEQIREHGKEQVIEKIAYIWFNRFCALRFMDVNRYTRIGVVSPVEGQFQPEILAEAKMGHIDEDTVPEKIRQQIFALLGGIATSRDAQSEAYRLLLVAACNDYHKAMPYLFERIADYTELLMPDDLLSANSILAYTREAMTPDICRDVEVIGWLYQFYISEKKDAVFDGLKKNKKITPENIPAATQLFTPHWIVRYLVENSLGRLWMLNRPNSRLFEQMDYYIKSEQAETDFLRINKPEELKICDPACGSGHLLVYAFDLLYAIYEEEGVDPAGIPEKILTHNLYGIEIDERAGELAAFALTMKARAKQRRFFSKQVAPNICVLENIYFDETEIDEYMDFVGQDIFTLGLKTTLSQFEEADNFGSLIRPEVTDVEGMLEILETKNVSEHLFLSLTHQKVLQVLQQADYLSPKYHVVIANPPYMGGKGMNGRLGVWLKDNYADVKSDLFSAFIVRCCELCTSSGYIGIMSPNVWMYISSHQKLRTFITEHKSLINLVELPLSGFKGATVQICAYNIVNHRAPESNGGFVRLVGFKGGDEKMAAYTRDAIKNQHCGWFFRAYSADFKTIPSSPIAYWVSETFRNIFLRSKPLSDISPPRLGMTTGDNGRFLRLWHEVSYIKIGFNCINSDFALRSGCKWFPYNKGGEFRLWYGNKDYVVNWENNGKEILEYNTVLYGSPTRNVRSIKDYFRESITWSFVSSSSFGVRHSNAGSIFDVGGSSIFPNPSDIKLLTGFLCTKLVFHYLKAMNPSLNFQVGNVADLPVLSEQFVFIRPKVEEVVDKAITNSKLDWEACETSWDFTSLPLMQSDYRQATLNATYDKLRAHWQEMTLEMQRLEQENNRIFIDAYGLQDELIQEVPLKEITLTCNPYYRYGNNKNEEELEVLLLADTMKEFISYAVGCMFGRYALGKPGLILANQGEILTDYLKQIPEPSIPADEDNVIPMLDGDWFTDDITECFCKFLKVTFGEEHYEENLTFIEKSLGKDIRKYFLKDFYNDHVRRYKKRPIYWLFSSPKGSFNALIYMHRYRPDTVSVVLNDYLREFRTKLSARKNHLEAVSISGSASQGERAKH